MNVKAEARKILGRHIYIDDDESLVNAVAGALEARDKEIAELKVEIERLKKQLETPLQVISQIRFVP